MERAKRTAGLVRMRAEQEGLEEGQGHWEAQVAEAGILQLPVLHRTVGGGIGPLTRAQCDIPWLTLRMWLLTVPSPPPPPPPRLGPLQTPLRHLATCARPCFRWPRPPSQQRPAEATTCG